MSDHEHDLPEPVVAGAKIAALIFFFLNELRRDGLVAQCVFCGYPVPTPLQLPDGSYRCGACIDDMPNIPDMKGEDDG